MTSFNQFSFPEKVYLSGADCFHLMLEVNAQKYQTGNNVIRIVFYFENEDSPLEVINNIRQSPVIFWMCNITLINGFALQKPYWKYTPSGNTIHITEHRSSTNRQIPDDILHRNISVQQDCLIEFDLIRYDSGKAALVLSWHHLLMDGRGSGILLRHLNHVHDLDSIKLAEFFPKPKEAPSIFRQLKNLIEVKRFIEKSSKAPIASVVSQKEKGDNTFKIKTLHFNKTETELIDLNAKKNGARFGANIFLIAGCAHIIHQLNLSRKNENTIWLPVPYDGRRRGGNGPVITNCISFLFYRLELSQLVTVKATVDSINQQMAEQLKNELPKKYNLLLDLMRHFPLKLYHYLTTRSSKGVVSSFLYSSAGEDMWDMNTLIEKPVEDILILPPLIYPPGITFSFLRHNNSLKMNIVYSENSLNDVDLELITNSVKTILLGNY